MKRNLRMSSSILPSEICSGPRWELAVKREMSLSELKMLAMANSASAIRVGCHISHSSRGREELYWRGDNVFREPTVGVYFENTLYARYRQKQNSSPKHGGLF